MESNADCKAGIAALFRKQEPKQAEPAPRVAETLTTNNGPRGTTIFAMRDRETFTVGINDAHDNQIGIFSGVDNVPHGLMLADGYVIGYYAGVIAGQKQMYRDICTLFGVTPDPKTLAAIGSPGANKK